MELLLELALSAKRNVLIAGPRGCGKTTICRHFLQARGQLMSHLHIEGWIILCNCSSESHDK